MEPSHTIAFSPDGFRLMAAQRWRDIFLITAYDWTLTREQIEQQRLEEYRKWVAERE